MSPIKFGIGLGRNPVRPEISKSDADFLKDGVEFVYNSRGEVISIGDLNELFVKVGFPYRDPVRLRHALDHTHTMIWIRATKTTRWARQDQMLGFARATSDGALTATIWDVAVNPAWQRIGLGRGMVERLVGTLCDLGVPLITLYAEPDVVGMYERLGFLKDNQDVSGMAFQRTSPEGRALVATVTS